MSQSWSKRVLKRHLVAGLIVITPVTATAFVLWWIFQLLDGLLGRFLYPVLGRYVPWIGLLPGLGLLVLIALLVLVGWLAEWAVGSRAVAWWRQLLERIPVTRRIYSAADRIVRTVLSKDERPFNAVVLVEYPSDGRWSIGFLAARAPEGAHAHVRDAVSVFIPKTPNIATGFVVVVPRDKTIPLDMTVDEAFTYILSAGSVVPESTRASLAGAAPADVPASAEELTGTDAVASAAR